MDWSPSLRHAFPDPTGVHISYSRRCAAATKSARPPEPKPLAITFHLATNSKPSNSDRPRQSCTRDLEPLVGLERLWADLVRLQLRGFERGEVVALHPTGRQLQLLHAKGKKRTFIACAMNSAPVMEGYTLSGPCMSADLRACDSS